MGSWLQDARHSFRALARRRGFSAAVAVTLALGIGGATTMFAVVEGVLLRPLPFQEPDRLVRLWETTPTRSFRNLAPANFLDARAGAPGIVRLSAYRETSANLLGEGEPERLPVATVSADFFETLGVDAQTGRAFDGDPLQPGAANTAVLAHAFWVRRFGGDPGVIGRSLLLNGEAVTVVGVMPSAIDFPEGVALWMKAPLDVPLTGPRFDGDHTRERTSWYFDAVGRLAPGVSMEQAQAQLEGVARQVRQADPESNGEMGFRLVPLHEQTVGDARSTIWLLFGAVSLVLVMACANVAGLVLVRSVERRSELAVRAALGAGTGRLVRHLAIESALLGALGGALGLAAALAALGTLRGSWELPRGATIGMSPQVLGFAVGVTALTTAAFSLLPALSSVAGRPGTWLGRRDEAGTGAGTRFRRGMVAGQVALAVVLVLGSALVIQSLHHLSRVDLGIRTEGLAVLHFSLPSAADMETEAWQGAYDRIVEAVRAVPGVEAAGISSTDPLSAGWSAGLRVEGREYDANNPPDVAWAAITPGYLDALGTPIVEGRGFTSSDRSDAAGVAVVNETFAEQIFAGESPLGRQINTGLDGRGRYVTIVGVMQDVRNRGPALPTSPAYVRPLAQPAAYGGERASLAVRTALPAGTVVPAVQRAVRSVAPDAPFSRIESGDRLGRAYATQVRFVSWVLGLFAAAALALGAVGIYGIASASARRRTREIGVRMALGARPGHAARIVLGESVVLASVGAAVGGMAALGVMRLLSGVLFGVRPSDPLTYAGVVAFLVAVAALSAWSPARRAARVDPLTALRSD